MNARQLEKRLGVSRAKPTPRKSMLEIVLDGLFSRMLWEIDPLRFLVATVPALIGASIIAAIISILAAFTGFADGVQFAVVVMLALVGLGIFMWFRFLNVETTTPKKTKAQKAAEVRYYRDLSLRR